MLCKDPFSIIVDTREQIPWEFGLHVTSHEKLDTGDYTIKGLEHLLCIERKRSVSEICNNVTEPRFKDVLMRMGKIPYSFMLFEFDLQEVYSFPVGSEVPKKKWDQLKISAKYVLKYLTEAQLNYGIHILYCGDAENAEKMAVSIMKRVYEKHGTDIQQI